MKDDVLAQLEEKDKQFRTSPFISNHGGGMHCYNVPEERLRVLYDAFITLFGKEPEVIIITQDVENRNSVPLLLMQPLFCTVPLETVYVNVKVQACGDIPTYTVSVRPISKVWDKVELRMPEKGHDNV